VEAAHGRVLLEDVRSRADRPTHDDSALDGFACRAADTASATVTDPVILELVGESVAGAPFAGHVARGQAVSVATGALVPEGVDAVIGVEHASVVDGEVTVTRPADPKAVRPRAQDLRAGERYLRAGTRLSGAAVGLAAAMGHASVTVARRPRVAILTTGDEVVTSDRALTAGQVYDANGAGLAALVRAAGCEVTVLAHVPDDGGSLARVLDRVASAMPAPDLIVTSGGVSRGERDVVRDAMLSTGQLHFWRVTVRPGGPTMFGRYAGVPLLGLAGNPVSSLVGWLLFGRAFTDTWSGCDSPLPYYDRLPVRPDGPFRAERKTVLYRARLERRDGILVAIQYENQSSGVLRALVESDALVVVPGVGNGDTGAEGTRSSLAAIDLRRWL
jgi:molybdopterin molybdotransferase